MTGRQADVLPAARADLLDIFEWLAAESENVGTAERFVFRILSRCDELAALSTQLGREREDLAPGLRSTPWRDYLIFFRYVDDRFEVVRIVHAARDLRRQFPPNRES